MCEVRSFFYSALCLVLLAKNPLFLILEFDLVADNSACCSIDSEKCLWVANGNYSIFGPLAPAPKRLTRSS